MIECRDLAMVSTVAVLMGATLAYAAEPIALRDMGSFHVGGRLVEIRASR